jgi:hypothetical protein
VEAAQARRDNGRADADRHVVADQDPVRGAGFRPYRQRDVVPQVYPGAEHHVVVDHDTEPVVAE